MNQLTLVRSTSSMLRAIIIVLRYVAAIVLLCTWVNLVWMSSELTLDYPLRRAGDSAEFPPLGTLPFYLGCAQALLGRHVIWIILFAVPLAFIIKGCGVGSWRGRFLLSLAVLSLPIIAFGTHRIHAFMEFVRANPVVVRHPPAAEGL